MTVTSASSHVLQFKGKPTYFCGPECKARYAAKPARYQVAAAAAQPVSAPATALAIDDQGSPSGVLTMRADRVGDATVLSGMVRMVGQAQRSTAPMQRMADRLAAWFVAAVIGAALLTFEGWGWLGLQPG